MHRPISPSAYKAVKANQTTTNKLEERFEHSAPAFYGIWIFSTDQQTVLFFNCNLFISSVCQRFNVLFGPIKTTIRVCLCLQSVDTCKLNITRWGFFSADLLATYFTRWPKEGALTRSPGPTWYGDSRSASSQQKMAHRNQFLGARPFHPIVLHPKKHVVQAFKSCFIQIWKSYANSAFN